MRTPDEFLKNVGFIVSKVDDDFFDVEATGFFVVVPSAVDPAGSYGYFVTAKHTALALRDRPIEILVNRKGGGIARIENPSWFAHDDPSIDIAVAPLPFSENLDIVVTPREMFLTPASMVTEMVGTGDEVFFPGLFEFASGLATGDPSGDCVEPIVRHGNIAMIPRQRIFIQIGSDRLSSEMYLIEARSIGGISGSPVFVRQTIRLNAGKDYILGLGKVFLLGLIHGHWDIKESEMNKYRFEVDTQRGVNLGIATVTPAHKLLEVLDDPILKEGRERSDAEYLASITPTPDGGVK